MLDQLVKVGIPVDQVNIIDEPARLYTLKAINLISYERLRMLVADKPKDTYAKRLRRRIGILVANEGEKLSNVECDQSRALFQALSDKYQENSLYSGRIMDNLQLSGPRLLPDWQSRELGIYAVY